MIAARRYEILAELENKLYFDSCQNIEYVNFGITRPLGKASTYWRK